MSEEALVACKKMTDFEEFMKHVINKGEEILQKTPELLPVLAKAGVVDAGGRGLMFIFSGFYKALTGEMAVEFIDNVEKDVTINFEHIGGGGGN